MTTFDQRDKRVETCVKFLSKVSFQFFFLQKVLPAFGEVKSNFF